MSAHALRVAEREKARRKQRRAEAKECPMHAFMRHGEEAEELRAGVERLLADYWNPNDYNDDLDALRGELQELLDKVDARDSLAYRERRDAFEEQGLELEVLRDLGHAVRAFRCEKILGKMTRIRGTAGYAAMGRAFRRWDEDFPESARPRVSEGRGGCSDG